ncbi:MAG: DUF4275 family protein [Zoogloeaceae bacterium]|nr:DUF4275 family protein [Zoogloeaceae bacterium]
MEPGRVLRHFTEKEALKWAERWISVYAQDARGANIKAYLWHTFSSGRYPCVCKQEAEDSYRRQIATEIVVLSNSRRSGLLTDALPTNLACMDYCVFPVNMAWTMAFTHEDGWLGPYFATHPDYKKLVAQDAERLRALQQKAKEIEHAKQRGWL